jgi:hypothetical protein
MTYQSGPVLIENQKQILYGTILGGSSIIKPDRGKNCYLAMRDNNKDWLQFKVDSLSDFFKIDDKTIKQDKNTYRCYSVAYPIFNDIYNVFYKDGEKFVAKEVLEILTDEAWMTWFIDAGRKSKRKAYLRTHKFGEEGTKMIAEYFNSLDCECLAHQCRSRHEIVFSKKGAEELFKYILPKVPENMLHLFD